MSKVIYEKAEKPKNESDISEVNILLEQRKVLVDNIKEINSNMFKVVVAIIPGMVSMIISYSDFIVPENVGPLVRFFIIEFILILSMVISAFLFDANIHRDYVVAIDKYLCEEYSITALIYEGELSRNHVTGVNGIFPLMTTLIGCSAGAIIIVLILAAIINDISYYTSSIWHIFLLGFIILQILFYGIIIAKNHVRKVKQKSKISDECLDYLNRLK